MDPEAPSPRIPDTNIDTQPSQPAPSVAPAATSPVAPSAPTETNAPAANSPIDATWQSPLKQIRTYQGDIAEALHSQNESLVSIRAAEKARADLLRKREEENARAKHEKTPEEKAADKKRLTSIAFFFGAIILIAAAGTAGYYAYTTYLMKTAVPVVEIPKNRFLPVTSTNTVDSSVVTREGLVSLLADERSKALHIGAIEHIELMHGTGPTATLETPTQFLILIGAKPPGNLVRAFDPLFMLGVMGQPAPAVVSMAAASTTATTTTATSTATSTLPASVPLPAAEANATVLLMKLDSFDNSFAGMFDWEKNMKEDLLPLFHNADVVALVPSDAVWTDVTIKNKDARELKDASGKTELIYSFYNQNLLIITTSEDALRTLIAELDTQALAR